MKRRAIFYIDGYNLYGGLCQGQYDLIWLDLQALCARLTKAKTEQLEQVKQFTARKPSPLESLQRQQIYLNALKTHCPTLQVIEGKFHWTDQTCKMCSHTYTQQREKQTDVNIAVSVLEDALKGMFDVAYLITADSDQVPTIQTVKRLFPSRLVKVFFPPNLGSEDLRHYADFAGHIPIGLLRMSQLPDPVLGRKERQYYKPSEWNTPFKPKRSC